MKYLVFAALCLSLVGCKPAETPPPIRPVRAMQLEEQELIRLHSFPGRTRAVERVNLSFRVEGPLIERPIKVGDEAVAGQLLARIDPRDFEVHLDNAQGKLEQAEANLRFAESDYERSMNIYRQDPGAISESYLDRKKEDVGRLKGEVKSLEANVESAEDELSYTYMNSPFDGMIVATYVENFEYVKAKQPIMRLLDNSLVEMVINVPESLITQIPYVEDIYVMFDVYPEKKFPAKVKEIGTEASLTTRTYPVTLIINQPEDEPIFSGMAGYAYLASSTTPGFSEEGFLIPSTAVITDDELDKTFVWVVDPETHRVHQREVTKGRLTADGVLVIEGVEKGEWVVTSGANSLKEGQEVKLPSEESR